MLCLLYPCRHSVGILWRTPLIAVQVGRYSGKAIVSRGIFLNWFQGCQRTASKRQCTGLIAASCYSVPRKQHYCITITKNSYFDLKRWVTVESKIRPGISSNWRIFESNWLDFESLFDSNIESILLKYSPITRNPRSNFSSDSDSPF